MRSGSGTGPAGQGREGPQPDVAIFLNGGYGVGKSAALDHVGDLLAEAGRPFSLMDVDWFHRSWPVADGDPSNVLLEACNIAAVWRGYRSAGPRQLVMCGVIETEADRQRYAAAVEGPLRLVRLRASPDVIHRRLRSRYTASRASALQWHLDRSAEVAARLEEAGLEELVIDTDALTPRGVAELTLRHFGLLD